MKTKIHDTYIDLREVVSIGPLVSRHHHGSHSLIGCDLKLFNQMETVFYPMSENPVDPYQADDSKNALTRATAQANYQVLVDKWLATD